jgi:hypothetical protein
VTGAVPRPGRPSCPCHRRRRAAPPITCHLSLWPAATVRAAIWHRAGSSGTWRSSHHPQRVILRLGMGGQGCSTAPGMTAPVWTG